MGEQISKSMQVADFKGGVQNMGPFQQKHEQVAAGPMDSRRWTGNKKQLDAVSELARKEEVGRTGEDNVPLDGAEPRGKVFSLVTQ